MNNARISILMLSVLSMGLAGCFGLGLYGPTTGPSVAQPASYDLYKPADFKKWASGMYVDEYLGQWVVAEGIYAPNQYAGLTQSTGEDIAFFLRPRSQSQSMGVTVKAPLSFREQIFSLEPDQLIRVYGRVQGMKLGGMTTLELKAVKIQAKEQTKAQ